MDELDRKIVDVLQAEGRISIPQLAERVDTSRATAYARFDRLNSSGVISGYSAQVDPHSLGYDVAAMVRVSSVQENWSTLADQLLNIHGVCWVGLSAGGADFEIMVRAHDLRELRDVVLEGIVRLQGVMKIETNVLLEEYGNIDRMPALDDPRSTR